ncbi:plasma kallikrein [Diabrotica virgifera virgifera]|uniref:Peptidase S1 domain-containing protein n=1 Tax=Diabrotica virgifera virgifera TaxID=50390 RepID=A0ABM5ITS7_DIAVI|nr:plasma kallikrein [Diabrotica virgifera virgifera]
MRFLFLLVFIYCSVVDGFSIFSRQSSAALDWNDQLFYEDDHLQGYRKGVSDTGRVFVKMLGFPSKCERKGQHHACTLSLACWIVGGSSQSGCGGSPWIVACCVTGTTDNMPAVIPYEDYNDLQENLEFEDNAGLTLQKRIDDFSPLLEDNYDQCGVSFERVLSKRIIGGREANFAQFPWQAYIKVKTFQCGGVLVSRKFVATAAHCIIAANLKDIWIYLGELDTQDTGSVKELAPADLHMVRKKIVHPQFRYRATQPDRFDLALLELATEASTHFHISPICLPDNDMELTGREAVVAGWGKIKRSNDLMGTNVLRSATVPILDIKECVRWHKLNRIYVDLHSEMLCAGHENGKQDACLGDSGGPLIILERGRWTLVGIISAGFGCGVPHQPGIYHKIPVTAEWIRNVIVQ